MRLKSKSKYANPTDDLTSCAAELAARHEGHRQDVAEPAARHLRRPLSLVRDLHLASTPLPGESTPELEHN